MFLTESELETLTGYKLGKKQCEWLTRKGWVFEPNAHGKMQFVRSPRRAE